MDISQLLAVIAALEPSTKAEKEKPGFPLSVGTNVLIRTVTNYFSGEVTAVKDGFVQLSTAAWIADTGRWNTSIQSGDFSEIEPYGDLKPWVSIASVVDVVEVTFKLPIKVK